VTVTHRRVEYVVARSVARAIAMGIICCALGNLLLVGGALAWLRAVHGGGSGLWILGAAALTQFVGGAAALIALGWSR
jgi:hypothetical protein